VSKKTRTGPHVDLWNRLKGIFATSELTLKSGRELTTKPAVEN